MSQKFLEMLRGNVRFSGRQLALCTHYSWFGVAKQDKLGIEEVYLYYNRVSSLLSPNLLTFEIEYPHGVTNNQQERENLPLCIDEGDARSFTGSIIFRDTDILCYHANLDENSDALSIKATLSLPATDPKHTRKVSYNSEARRLVITTLVPRSDHRDPDSEHQLVLCINIPPAFSEVSSEETKNAGDINITFTASAEDFAKDEQTFVIGIGEGPSADEIENRVALVTDASLQTSCIATVNWLLKSLDNFSFDGIPEQLHSHYANAAYQMLSNTKAPRGQLKRFSSYPNRGSYSAHYLWDACFTSLGTSHFSMQLAEDYLLGLCDNQEEDGKMPQFICATWNRPDESQPPLIAWAAWRLYEQSANRDFIGSIYTPICKMVDWWFAKRDQDDDGLPEYQHPLESGWDDSPRFDKGRIAAVDLNSFLNREMQILSRMAVLLGKVDEASEWSKRAAVHAKRMCERLFDREDGVFYDRLVEQDQLHKVLTPASFMPLWAEVKVSREIADQMIMKYLINPKHFFGSRPFPVVAYSDPNYKPERWWRGPVWPNIAWAMTEVLRIHGFEKERKESIRRLVDMMTEHNELHELYNSATGEPLGSPALCWTCSVFMEMAKDS